MGYLEPELVSKQMSIAMTPPQFVNKTICPPNQQTVPVYWRRRRRKRRGGGGGTGLPRPCSGESGAPAEQWEGKPWPGTCQVRPLPGRHALTLIIMFQFWFSTAVCWRVSCITGNC